MRFVDILRISEQVARRSETYADVYGFERTPEWFMLKLQEEVGELTQAFMAMEGTGRARNQTPAELKQKFRDEIADVLCHTLLLADHYGVDPVAAIDAKWFKYDDGLSLRQSDA
ncbi:MazG nucleotide pyrophosphohydrolase domain-containing protein [Haematomicrobium sanguinis]|uniref:MazG nucleotide pyrophosphohydrolase domain-containing protein n=1 Tax=Haematomicrobium sanguinis TaxID=479106 RepID=UPI000A5B051F|nr:MazG nucleotide pyrophosphohydrolase domain-containing protein [Haematomicrobium sanguinis]